ncbi:MAG: hypothetical protein WC606_03260 [Candidatus Absconditabacterales bacterium]
MKKLLILLFITGIVVIVGCGGVNYITKSQEKKQQDYRDSILKAKTETIYQEAKRIAIRRDSVVQVQQLNLKHHQNSLELAKLKDSVNLVNSMLQTVKKAALANKTKPTQVKKSNLDLKNYDSVPWTKLDTATQRKLFRFANVCFVNTPLNITCKKVISIVLVKEVPSRLGKSDDQFLVTYVTLDGTVQVALLRKDGTTIIKNTNGTFSIIGPDGDDYRLPPHRG